MHNILIIYSVDATAETTRLGRLINHSKADSNLKVKIIEVEGSPTLCFFAAKRITAGQELLYDYGDRRKSCVLSNPWLLK